MSSENFSLLFQVLTYHDKQGTVYRTVLLPKLIHSSPAQLNPGLPLKTFSSSLFKPLAAISSRSKQMSSTSGSHSKKFTQSWTQYRFCSFTAEILQVPWTYWKRIYFIATPKCSFLCVCFPTECVHCFQQCVLYYLEEQKCSNGKKQFLSYCQCNKMMP